MRWGAVNGSGSCRKCMNLKNLFLILAIVFLVIGLSGMFLGHSSSTMAMIEGIAKGLAGVFFILFYIFMLLGKQPTDKTTH
jgi:uncharacterized membrane protein YfcA